MIQLKNLKHFIRNSKSLKKVQPAAKYYLLWACFVVYLNIIKTFQSLPSTQSMLRDCVPLHSPPVCSRITSKEKHNQEVQSARKIITRCSPKVKDKWVFCLFVFWILFRAVHLHNQEKEELNATRQTAQNSEDTTPLSFFLCFRFPQAG